MKRFLSFAIILFSLIGGVTATTVTERYPIIPLPNSIKPAEGAFKLTSSVKISVPADDANLKKIATRFVSQVTKTSGIKLAFGNASAKQAIVFLKDKQLASEAYQLNISSNRVEIKASTEAGFFYAIETVKQLLPASIYGEKLDKKANWSIPCSAIEDSPRFAYRGSMLDVGRHFMPKKEVFKYIDMLAMHKMNRFHFHLTEDQGWRIEIKKYPKLTEIGSKRKETLIGHPSKDNKFDGKEHKGFYTQAEIKEIVAYAADRFITVIPEIEMPGHALAAIASYPELACGHEKKYEVGTVWGVYEQVYCPKESTFEFLENVLSEVIELFPSKYIHIGGDECPKASWKKCANCQALMKKENLKNEEELQSYFIHRIEKYLNSKGRNIIGWDEILEGGLAPNATVMSWRGEAGGIEAAKQGHDVIMSPNSYCYFDHYQEDPNVAPLAIGGYSTLQHVYSYEPLPAALSAEERKHVLGAQANLWTEYIPTPQQLEYMAYPRLTALSEVLWTNPENKNWKEFTQRMLPEFDRYKKIGLNACRNFYVVNIEPKKQKESTVVVELNLANPNAEVRYTLDGSEPNAQSPLYTTAISIDKTGTVKAAAFEKGKLSGVVSNRKVTVK